MRKLCWPVLFLLCFSLQMSLPQWDWFKFDLLLILVYIFAMLKGATKGGVIGAVVGLLQDSLTIGIFGFHILTRSVIGYYVGYTKEKVFKDSLLYNIVAISFITIILRSCYFLLEMYFVGGISWLLIKAYFVETFAYCLGNVYWYILLSWLCRKINNWIKKDDIL